MKNLRLGIPLAVSMAGTVASLFVGGKRLHTAFGVAWTALSLVHAYQYRKNMKNNAKKGLEKVNILKAVGIPTTKLEWFLKSVKVASYIPGRIRVYSKALINNPQLKEKVENALAKYPELDKVTINLISGSVLIQYRPENIKANKELCEIENYAKNHVKR